MLLLLGLLLGLCQHVATALCCGCIDAVLTEGRNERCAATPTAPPLLLMAPAPAVTVVAAAVAVVVQRIAQVAGARPGRHFVLRQCVQAAAPGCRGRWRARRRAQRREAAAHGREPPKGAW